MIAAPAEPTTPEHTLMVLVVDDDADMRFYVRSCLQDLSGRDTRVIEAGDGMEALTIVRAGAADVVISDVRMPRLDGHGLCAGIKDDPALAHIPVLLISGKDASADGREDGFLTKPFNARQLAAALERIVGGEH